MTKTEIIEKISELAGVSLEEQKLFFEMLLVRIAEVLSNEQSLSVPDLGRFELRNIYDEKENNLLVFITNEEEEIPFIIPEKDETISAEPVDSYFSISIGKPVIPLRGSEGLEQNLLQTGSEIKNILELKVEKFIEDTSELETGIGKTNTLDDISFSFLNWKKSTDLNEEIYQTEQEIVDSFISESEKIEDDAEFMIEREFIPEEEIDNLNEAAEDIAEDEKYSVENEKELSEAENTEGEVVQQPLIIEKEVSTALHDEKEIILSDASDKNDVKNINDKNVRAESYIKKSYGGFIVAAFVIAAAAGVIYFSYYYSDRDEIPLVIQNNEPKEFKTVIERSYDIPVSYPYQAGMFGGFYKAINDELLTQFVPEESSGEAESEFLNTEASKIPEIRPTQPSERIKGYIYLYNDGTYAVQVSSWRSKSIALSETQKYLASGFNSFVEQSSLSGKPIYSVRIGGFNSIDEAENFLKK